MDDDLKTPRRENVAHDVRQQFEKKFKFQPIPPDVSLPPVETLYRCPPYAVPSLQEQKQRLNAVKSQLNDFEISDWHKHTRKRSSLLPILSELRYRIRAEFVTQAFAKLYECVSAYELVDPEADQLFSVHLCEAPGAFVTGLNHYIREKCRPRMPWQWFASTLNPYYEGNCPGYMISDDRFILRTLKYWCFNGDGTGDIMVQENREAIINRSKRWPTVHLVTADGSIDCLNVPAEQEERVSKLHLAEATLALALLSPGGHLILKMFTLFEHSSVSLLFLLNHCFEELHVFKPCTSKPGNSEVYLIAKHYRKPPGVDQYLEAMSSNLENDSHAIFDPSTVPRSFLSQVHECASRFVRWQTEVIEGNIRFYGVDDPTEDSRLQVFKETIMEMFFARYHIAPIPANERILCRGNLSSSLYYQKECHGSYNERVQSAGSASTAEKLHLLLERLDHLTLTQKVEFPKAQLADPPYNFSDPTNLHRALAFTVGKPIERVHSSKFAHITLIRLLNEIIDLHRAVVKPSAGKDMKHVLQVHGNVISTDITSYTQVTNADRYEKQLYHTIIRTILQLVQRRAGETAGDQQDTLILENCLLMTQFSVGLIYLLKMFVFESIEKLSPTRIVLQTLRPGGIPRLLELKDAFESTSCSASALPGTSKSILALVPITSLVNGGFYMALYNHNNALFLMYCAQLLSEVQKQLSSLNES